MLCYARTGTHMAISWSGRLIWLKNTLSLHPTACNCMGRREGTGLPYWRMEVSFNQLKVVAKLQLGSLNLDAILKLLANIEGHRDLGKSHPEIPILKVVCVQNYT